MVAQLSVEMTGDERKLAKKLVRAEANIDSLKRKLREAGKEGKRSGTQISTSMKLVQQSMAAFAGAAGLAGIQQSLGAINSSYQTWLNNQREIANEARKASNELIALAALQEGGRIAERVHEASRVAGGKGIYDQRGEVFNVVQSLQSVLGSWEKGLAAAETVFQATQLDVPMRYGLQLELVGASQGLEPGEAIRKAYVSGQLSGGNPKIISRAAPSLGVFDDPDFGFASAAGIAASFGPEELPTFVRGLGIALSSSSSPKFQETLAGLGVADATRIEKLRALSKAGIDTTDELAAAGLKEIVQARALNKALLPQNIATIEKVFRELPDLAVPGVMAKDRKRIEDEIPMVRVARENDILRARFKDNLAFGPQALPALELEQEQLLRGAALKELGLTQFLGYDLIDEQGRSTATSSFFAGLRAAVTGIPEADLTPNDLGDNSYIQRLVDKMEELRLQMEKTSENTFQMAQNGSRATERRPRINPDAQNE